MSKAVLEGDEIDDIVDHQVSRGYTSLNNLVTDLNDYYDFIAGFDSEDYFKDKAEYDILFDPEKFESQASSLEGDALIVFSEELLSSDSMSPGETEQLLEKEGYNFIAPSHTFGKEFYPPQNYGEDDVTGHWISRFNGKAIYIIQNSP